MKLTITMKKVAALKPCESRFENFKEHYPNFNGDFTEFLDLTEITHSDKLWVVRRLIPRELVEIFAVDCAVSAVAYSDSAADSAADSVSSAAYAAYAADSAAYAAAYAADSVDYAAAERARQIEALIWLVQSNKGKK